MSRFFLKVGHTVPENTPYVPTCMNYKIICAFWDMVGQKITYMSHFSEKVWLAGEESD